MVLSHASSLLLLTGVWGAKSLTQWTKMLSWKSWNFESIIHSSELEFLPVYHPSEEEKADPQVRWTTTFKRGKISSADNEMEWWSNFQVYADNVRASMAKKLQVPLCSLTFAEAKEKFGSKKSR